MEVEDSVATNHADEAVGLHEGGSRQRSRELRGAGERAVVYGHKTGEKQTQRSAEVDFGDLFCQQGTNNKSANFFSPKVQCQPLQPDVGHYAQAPGPPLVVFLLAPIANGTYCKHTRAIPSYNRRGLAKLPRTNEHPGGHAVFSPHWGHYQQTKKNCQPD